MLGNSAIALFYSLVLRGLPATIRCWSRGPQFSNPSPRRPRSGVTLALGMISCYHRRPCNHPFSLVVGRPCDQSRSSVVLNLVCVGHDPRSASSNATLAMICRRDPTLAGSFASFVALSMSSIATPNDSPLAPSSPFGTLTRVYCCPRPLPRWPQSVVYCRAKRFVDGVVLGYTSQTFLTSSSDPHVELHACLESFTTLPQYLPCLVLWLFIWRGGCPESCSRGE